MYQRKDRPFSATMPKEIVNFAKRYQTNPQTIKSSSGNNGTALNSTI